MNILIDIPPKSVTIDSLEYEINSNFRESILFEIMMQDEGLEYEEKILNALELYYPIIPENIEEAIKTLIWFYNSGQEENIATSSSGNDGSTTYKAKRIYSFEYDADYIYSAFMSQYGIDLESIEYLHWWKFKALFKSLGKDNKISEIMNYRAIDLSSIKDKEQKKFYKSMKKLYDIPNDSANDEEEKLIAIKEAFMRGENIDDLINDMD